MFIVLAHQAVQPPSTATAAPVTKLEAGDARNSNGPAISSACPVRPSMVLAASRAAKLGSPRETSSAWKRPGNQSVDANSFRSQLGGEMAGQLQQRRLGRAVMERACLPGLGIDARIGRDRRRTWTRC